MSARYASACCANVIAFSMFRVYTILRFCQALSLWRLVSFEMNAEISLKHTESNVMPGPGVNVYFLHGAYQLTQPNAVPEVLPTPQRLVFPLGLLPASVKTK